MDKQPEALRLADEFEKQIWNSAYRAAAELRRLHQVNQELVEALEAIILLHATPSTICKDRPAFEQALALIAKHKEQA